MELPMGEIFGNAEFVQKLLIALVPVVLAGLMACADKRFGWRASLLRDTEAYRELAEIAGDDLTEEERRVLGVMRQRAFKSAKRSMEQNKYASIALHAVLVLNFVVGALSFFDLFQYANGMQSKELHGVVTALLVLVVTASVITMLWFCFDSIRAIDARKLEVEYWNAERDRKREVNEKDRQTTETTLEVLAEVFEKRRLEEHVEKEE